jgi:hypothetical protein
MSKREKAVLAAVGLLVCAGIAWPIERHLAYESRVSGACSEIAALLASGESAPYSINHMPVGFDTPGSYRDDIGSHCPADAHWLDSQEARYFSHGAGGDGSTEPRRPGVPAFLGSKGITAVDWQIFKFTAVTDEYIVNDPSRPQDFLNLAISVYESCVDIQSGTTTLAELIATDISTGATPSEVHDFWRGAINDICRPAGVG